MKPNADPVDLYNSIDDQSLLEDAFSNKISVLAHFIDAKNPVVVSLGCGGGQELVAFNNQFPAAKKIIGLDVSPIALDRAQELCARNAFEPSLINSSALSMPFSSESIDAICASHILHEIYSDYGEDGWLKTVKECCRVLSNKGSIFIRDFAAPSVQNLKIQPKTAEAYDFMNYFADSFSKAFHYVSDSHLALETLLHFKTFQSDSAQNITFIGDQTWHELTESYVPPFTTVAKKQIMYITQQDYVNKLISAMEDSRVTCAYSEQLPRLITNTLLDHHFKVNCEQHLSSMETISLCTRKMQLVIKK